MSKDLRIFCDGGARGNPGPAACAFVVKDDKKIIFRCSKYLGVSTNNVAEYQAVVNALRWLEKNEDKQESVNVNFYLDSQLVERQLNGLYKVKSSNIKKYFLIIKKLESKIVSKINYHHVYRNDNKLPDLLLNKVLDNHR